MKVKIKVILPVQYEIEVDTYIENITDYNVEDVLSLFDFNKAIEINNSDLKSALSISINSTEEELWSTEK